MYSDAVLPFCSTESDKEDKVCQLFRKRSTSSRPYRHQTYHQRGKVLTSMFVKRAQSASPLGRTRKGRSPLASLSFPPSRDARRFYKALVVPLVLALRRSLGPPDAERQLSSTSLPAESLQVRFQARSSYREKSEHRLNCADSSATSYRMTCSRVHLLSANASCFTRCSDCAMM